MTAAGLVAMLAGEAAGRRWVSALAKPLASTGFLVAAFEAGAAATPYGQAVLVALALSFMGDVLLLGRSRLPFLLGLVFFLLGHLAYVWAFGVLGVDARAAGGALLLLALPAWLVLRWLWPHVPGKLRGPVAAYVVVITVMVAAAAGAVAAGFTAVLLGAAFAFYLSDLAVARERFVSPGGNRLWGLPLYYGAQLAFAWTTGLPAA